jgi:hypothetical protein
MRLGSLFFRFKKIESKIESKLQNFPLILRKAKPCDPTATGLLAMEPVDRLELPTC